jgi:hypothetical protein
MDTFSYKVIETKFNLVHGLVARLLKFRLIYHTSVCFFFISQPGFNPIHKLPDLLKISMHINFKIKIQSGLHLSL